MESKEICDLYSDTIHNRIIFPENGEENFKNIINTLDGKFIGFKSGYYDGGIHPNHEWSLRDLRLQLVKKYYSKIGKDYDALSVSEKRKALMNNDIALVILIPGNEHTKMKKSFSAKKGFIPRPILDWKRRAVEVANVTIPNDAGLLFPVVDVITGYDSILYPNTIFDSYLSIGEFIKPNVWFVSNDKDDDTSKFDILKNHCDEIFIVSSDGQYEINPITNNSYSTTDTYSYIINEFMKNKLS